MAKNIEINYNDGMAYQVLYPKTLASNIEAGTFSGQFAFDTIPTCETSPTTSYQLTNKSYIDSTLNSYATVEYVTSMISANMGSDNAQYKTYTGTGSSTTLYYSSVVGCKLVAIMITIDGFYSSIGSGNFANLFILNGTQFHYVVGTSSNALGFYIGEPVSTYGIKISTANFYKSGITYYTVGIFGSY